MTDLMLMFEREPDSSLLFDFDTMSREKKKAFIEKVFDVKRTIIDVKFNGSIASHFFMGMLEKIYREKLDDLINGLNGKMTFNKFNSYFGSFIKIEWN